MAYATLDFSHSLGRSMRAGGITATNFEEFWPNSYLAYAMRVITGGRIDGFGDCKVIRRNGPVQAHAWHVQRRAGIQTRWVASSGFSFMGLAPEQRPRLPDWVLEWGKRVIQGVLARWLYDLLKIGWSGLLKVLEDVPS